MKKALDLLPIDFRKKLEKAHAAALANPKPKSRVVPQKEKVVRLPTWPDGARGVPNGLLRSALFSVVKRGRRAYTNHTIVSLDGVHIEYTGEQLNQNDLDVWESVLHFAKHIELDIPVRITAYQLLKIQKKTDCGKNRQTLLTSMKRMAAGSLTIETEKYTYVGSLIHDFIRNDDTHEYMIWINPRLKPMFAPDQYTLIDWQTRLELDGKSLSQWLHGFYSSHAKPYPYKISTLKELCGSETTELWKFRQQLKKAIAQLCDSTGWKMWIDDDLLHIKK